MIIHLRKIMVCHLEGNQVNYKKIYESSYNINMLRTSYAFNIKKIYIYEFVLYFKLSNFLNILHAQLSKPFLKASSLLVSSPFVGNNQPPSVFSFHA